jgi:hypothetical protein
MTRRTALCALVVATAATLPPAANASPGVSAHAGESASLRALHAELTVVGDAASAPSSSDREHVILPDDARLLPFAPEPRESRWYGWQTLGADLGAGLALGVHGGLAVGVYALGGPTVHAAHGRWGAAAGSAALRITLPFLFAIVGNNFPGCHEARSDSDTNTCAANALGGAILGLASAVLIDALALSWEEVPADGSSGRRASKGVRIAVAPWIDRDRKGGSVAITF